MLPFICRHIKDQSLCGCSRHMVLGLSGHRRNTVLVLLGQNRLPVPHLSGQSIYAVLVPLGALSILYQTSLGTSDAWYQVSLGPWWSQTCLLLAGTCSLSVPQFWLWACCLCSLQFCGSVSAPVLNLTVCRNGFAAFLNY